MRKIDHIRKVVYIIVGILSIISLVFSLYKKIGKAASSDSEFFFTLPHTVDFTHSPFSLSDTNIIVDFIKNYNSNYLLDSDDSYINLLYWKQVENSGFDYDYIICLSQTNIRYNLFTTTSRRIYFSSNSRPVSSTSFSITTFNSSSLSQASPFYLVQRDGNNFSIIGFTNIYFSFNSNTKEISFLGSSVPAGTGVSFRNYLGIINPNTNITGFNSELPFYLPHDIYSGDFLVFKSTDLGGSSPINPIGHSKGGVLANYQDSFDLLEDSSDVPKVDTSSPADSSSVPAWLGKILNGLGVIGNSIQSGVLTIGDYIGTLGENIGEFFNSVGEKIDAIKDSIDSFFAWVTEPPNNETILSNIQPYLESNTMIQGFISSKNAIQGVYSDITGVNAKTSSQMKWTIPFNLPGLSNNFTATIDFGWYENIRSIVQPILIMIISVSFILSLIRSIPGILHGNSPEGDT